MPILDTVKKWLTVKPKLDVPPAPEGLYSPPERGRADPDPSDFNVGDPVKVMGTAQGGAPAVADQRRRPLKSPVHLPDGTPGQVRGVDAAHIFVQTRFVTPLHAWRKAGGQDPEFKPGDVVTATGPVEALSPVDVVLPNGTVATLVESQGSYAVVDVVFQYNKADWWNELPPDVAHRRWGRVAALQLRRSGYQRYVGSIDGRRVTIGRYDAVIHGSYPAGRRQKRRPVWRVTVDGQLVGERDTWQAAKALAATPPPPMQVQAKGLVDLSGLDERIAAACARAVRDLMAMTGGRAQSSSASWVAQAAAMARDLIDATELSDMYDAPVLRKPDADALFGAVQLSVRPGAAGGQAFGSFFGPDQRYRDGAARLVLYIAPTLAQLRTATPSYAALLQAFRTHAQHELRHAADWAYQEAARPGKFTDQHDALHISDVNRPTELKSHAGNVAAALLQAYGPKALRMTGTELAAAVQAVAPVIMSGMHSDNKPDFLRRVLVGLRGLAVAVPRTAAQRAEAAGWTLLTGDDRARYADAVWKMYRDSYAKIGLNITAPEQLSELQWWRVHINAKGEPDAFALGKLTPYGAKSIAAGTDGTIDGKVALKNYVVFMYSQPGFYAEVSHAMRKLSAGAPKVTREQAQRILEGKQLHPAADDLHAYERDIANVGRVQKIMVGLPHAEPQAVPTDPEAIAHAVHVAATALDDDAVAHATSEYLAQHIFADAADDVLYHAAQRIKVQQATGADDGEIELEDLKPGDRVRFLAEFDKPGWPRVDAGTIGEIVATYPSHGMLEVATLGTTAAADGATTTERAVVAVTRFDVAFIRANS